MLRRLITFAFRHAFVMLFLIVMTVLAVVYGAPYVWSSHSADQWSVAYRIAEDRVPMASQGSSNPRNGRGLAVSPDGRFLYAGYNDGFHASGEVRKIDLQASDAFSAVVARLPGVRGKAIDVDDRGRVYVAAMDALLVFDADLSRQLYAIKHVEQCEGVAVSRVNHRLLVYYSDRATGMLYQSLLIEKDDTITGHQMIGFGGGGVLALPGAHSLRGIAIEQDAQRLWVADYAGKVFRIAYDGALVDWVEVDSPIDLAFADGQLWVSQHKLRRLRRIKPETLRTSWWPTLPPWDHLSLDADGQSGNGALSGLAYVPARGLLIANETGQTQPKNPHVTDRAIRKDDNEPVLLLELRR